MFFVSFVFLYFHILFHIHARADANAQLNMLLYLGGINFVKTHFYVNKFCSLCVMWIHRYSVPKYILNFDH